MPKIKGQRIVGGWTDEVNLLDLLDEIENGPPACPHVPGVRMQTGGWAHEMDPNSPYYLEWVHGAADCRRSAFPGRKQPLHETA